MSNVKFRIIVVDWRDVGMFIKGNKWVSNILFLNLSGGCMGIYYIIGSLHSKTFIIKNNLKVTKNNFLIINYR